MKRVHPPSKIKKLATPAMYALLFASLSLNALFLKNQTAENPGRSVSNTVIASVVDGDTVITKEKIRVRLMNVEAPELGMCGGAEAKTKLEKIVLGKKVRINFIGEDNFNRSMGLVYVGDKIANQELLAGGFTRYDGSPSPERDKLRESYQKAVVLKKGIFGPPCRLEKSEKTNCVIKGNVERATKEKKYLFPSCPQYGQVMVERDLGEDFFCTEKEAVAAGFGKSKNCEKRKFN